MDGGCSCRIWKIGGGGGAGYGSGWGRVTVGGGGEIRDEWYVQSTCYFECWVVYNGERFTHYF